MYVAGIGLVWGLAQLVVAEPDSITIPSETAAIALCLAAGVCLTASNLLLIASLSHVDVSLGSTIYRLNTVGVVILSLLFLGEPLGVTKLTANDQAIRHDQIVQTTAHHIVSATFAPISQVTGCNA